MERGVGLRGGPVGNFIQASVIIPTGKPSKKLDSSSKNGGRSFGFNAFSSPAYGACVNIIHTHYLSIRLPFTAIAASFSQEGPYHTKQTG